MEMEEVPKDTWAKEQERSENEVEPAKPMKTKLKVSTELMQTLVNYLESKPHKEVHQLLMAVLQECNSQKPIPEGE